MLDADAVIIVLQLAAEMIFETATRHDRRNFYNSFGGLLPIVMHKTLYLFRNINRLVTPERRRWRLRNNFSVNSPNHRHQLPI